MSEIWKAIPGFEGAYEVSDLGRVRSLTRQITYRSCKGTVCTKMVQGQVLRPGRMTSGHLSVVLGREHGSICVHAAVMLAFVGLPPEGHEVRHLDGDPTNNTWPQNLEYATRGRNSQDKKHHAGAANYRLSPDDVADIKRRLDSGIFGIGRALAEDYGVAQSTISAIKHNKFHKDIQL